MVNDKPKNVLLCYPVPSPKHGFVSPKEFFDWAEKDLKGNSDGRARGNALGNIKKSIHCRIDEIINSTHLVFAKDWNWFTVRTEDKIKVIKDLGFRGTAITKIITDDRNNYEHKYKLPNIDVVRAHLDTAELWLDDSYKKHFCGRVGIFGLQVKRLEKVGDDIKKVIVSSEYRNVSYFWDSKKLLLFTSRKSRDPIEKNLKDMAWKDILNIEKQCLRGVDGGNVHVLSQAKLTKLFKTYNKHVDGRGIIPFFYTDMHFVL